MGLRGRRCPVCGNPELLPVVTALLEAGSTHAEIAERTGLSKDQIARHRRHASPPTAPADEPGNELQMSDQRLAVLAQRAESQWLAAVASGDGKAALDVLKTSVKLELENRARIQENRERTSTDDNLPVEKQPVTIAMLDKLVADALRAGGNVPCPLCQGIGNTSKEKIRLRLPLLQMEEEKHDQLPN